MSEAAVTADDQAKRAQRRYQRTVAAEQILLAVAATGGAGLWALGGGSGVGIGHVIVLLALAGAFGIRTLRSLVKPDVLWYTARSMAEDIQSQVWRYVTRAEPYNHTSEHPAAQPTQSAEMVFAERCQEIWNKANLDLWKDTQPPAEITPQMQRVRTASLAERIQVYRHCRLIDQRDYYRRRANTYAKYAGRWNLVILGLEGLAGIITLLRLIDLSPLHVDALAAIGAFFAGTSIDLYGLAATIVAGIAVWTQMKQYTTLERRYKRMARTLQSYIDVLDKATTPETITPDGWSALVNRVEHVLEQEHESWLHLYKGHAGEGKESSWKEFEQQLGASSMHVSIR